MSTEPMNPKPTDARLREEAERRAREARLEKAACEKAGVWRQYWVEHGKMAALDDLANWVAVTKEVQPIESSSATAATKRPD